MHRAYVRFASVQPSVYRHRFNYLINIALSITLCVARQEKHIAIIIVFNYLMHLPGTGLWAGEPEAINLFTKTPDIGRRHSPFTFEPLDV